MTNTDKRGKLQQEPFTFRETKDGKVFIYWHGKQIMILKDKAAAKFLANITNTDPQQVQLLMARVTGHFKHGNEGGN
ncbi:MAG: hypothetical protein H7Y59_13885 [Anaerolineales bacterium]|nr:hypothetical protein [Anaerolineales bacterium]